MDKVVIFIIIGVILLGVIFWGFQSGVFTKKPVVIPGGIILFYGQDCPHCKNVEEFILQNKIEEKVKFSRLEVWYNKDNQKIIADVAQKCGIAGDSVGVPLLYDGTGKCLLGDVDIINFFKNEAGIK